MGKDRTQSQKSLWTLHKERKHSLLMAILLSYFLQVPWWILQPLNHSHTERKEISLGFTQEMKCRKHTMKIQLSTNSVTILLLGLLSLFGGSDHFPTMYSNTAGRLHGLEMQGHDFPPHHSELALVTRTKGIKKDKGFFRYLFPLLVNESNFSLTISAVANTFSHCILLGLFTGEGFNGRGPLFSTHWYLRQFPIFINLPHLCFLLS